MSDLRLHSFNVAGRTQVAIAYIRELMRRSDILFLQDIGNGDMNGPAEWRYQLPDCTIVVNNSLQNSSRSVAIVFNNKLKQIGNTLRNNEGNLVGVCLALEGFRFLAVSAYMPPKLDEVGLPCGSLDEVALESELRRNQLVAQRTYEELTDWCKENKFFVIGGDFNETREPRDRSWRGRSSASSKPKFINNFLENMDAIDSFRHCQPLSQHFTRRTKTGDSKSRIDYILLSKTLVSTSRELTSLICPFELRFSDHAAVSTSLRLNQKPSEVHSTWKNQALRVGQLSQAQREELAEILDKEIHHCREKFEEQVLRSKDLKHADKYSSSLVEILNRCAREIVGERAPLAKPRKDPVLTKIRSKIRLLRKVAMMIVNLSDQTSCSVIEELQRSLRRMDKLGLIHPKISAGIRTWKQWADGLCANQIWRLENEAKDVGKVRFGRNDGTMHELFYKKRKKFYEHLAGKNISAWTIIDPESGEKVDDPQKIKEVVRDVCSARLRNMVGRPADYDGINPMAVTDAPTANFDKPPPIPRKNHLRNHPFWWKKMYSRKAKGIGAQVWNNLMKEVTEREVLDIISAAEPGKAAGYDGVSIDLIKILCHNTEKFPHFLKALTFLINFSLRAGTPLPSWKHAVITLIPKVRADGSRTEAVEDLRPISVLPEISKICSRVLASRIGCILRENPKIITDSQRGFLKDGNVMQCINAVLDVFEDAKQNKNDLYVVAYDIEKAYDSVQLYTILASLERFNLPESFIKFVAAGLKNASSCFKTPYGLTESFQINSSVRQGDPLAPLLFIMVIDALHDGLRSNPLFADAASGYVFKSNPSVRISSLGYADDTVMLMQSWQDVWRGHTWVREFCRANNLTINWSKTKFFSNTMKQNDPRCLWPVQGDEVDLKSETLPLTEKHKIMMNGPAIPFKYLGIWMNLDLEWEKQCQVMESIVLGNVQKMGWNRLKVHERIVMTKEIIFAQLDPGLQVANIPTRSLEKWNSVLMRALVSDRKWKTGGTLNVHAVGSLAGLPDLRLHFYARQIGELWVRLNSYRDISGTTTRARWDELRKLSNGRMGPAKMNRIARVLNNANKHLGVTINFNPPRVLELEALKIEVERRISKGQHVIAFTDGSTDVKTNANLSGAGVCLTANNQVIWEGGFRVCSYGNNYVAEYAAACVALAITPNHIPLTLVEDNLGAIASQWNTNLTERKRLRSSARGWRNTFESLLGKKSASVEICHIKAHTQSQDFLSLGNASADALAKWALQQSSPPLPVSGEECFTLQIQGKDVIDDGLYALRKRCREIALEKWKGLQTQGRIVRSEGVKLIKQSKRILQLSHEYNDGDLWLFYVFMVCSWVPTNYRRWKAAQTSDPACSLCTGKVTETFKHLFVCPALRNEQEELKGVSIYYLSIANLRSFADPQETHLEKTFQFIRKVIPKPDDRRDCRVALTDEKLRDLIRLFVVTNQDRQGLSRNKCLYHIQRLLKQRACECSKNQRHTCALKNCWQTPLDLVKILKDSFALNFEGMADGLHHRSIFQKWCSEFVDDAVFGARHDFFNTDLRGENFFVNPPFNSVQGHDIMSRVIDRCLLMVKTQLPTRCVLVVPVFQGSGGDRFLRKVLQSQSAIVLMYFPANTFTFDPPDTYCLEKPRAAVFYHEVAIVLLCSPTSLVFDSLDWIKCSQKLVQWARGRGISATVPTTGSPLALFLQSRILPRSVYQPVTYAPLLAYLPWMEPGRLDKYPLSSFSDTEGRQRRACEKLMKLNSVVAAAGIFPSEVQGIFADKTPDEKMAIMKKWSLASFWSTFKIWKRRCQLVHAQAKAGMSLAETKCNSPFHFLVPVTSNSFVCMCPKKQKERDVDDGSSNEPLSSLLNEVKPEVKVIDPTKNEIVESKTEDETVESKNDEKKLGLRRSERISKRLASLVEQKPLLKRKRKANSKSRSAKDCENRLTARRKKRK